MAQLNSTIVNGNLNTTGTIFESGKQIITSQSYSSNTLTNTPSTTNIIVLTQAQYDAITSKDPNTVYLIKAS